MIAMYVSIFIGILVLVLCLVRPQRIAGFRGPPMVPLLRNGIQALLHYSDPMAWLKSCTDKYGLTWAGQIPGHPPTVVVSDPVNVEHILHTNFDNYIKGGNITEIGSDLLGDGIFNTNGASWKLQRRTAGPLFRHKSLRDMVPVFVFHAKQVQHIFAQYALTGAVIDVQSIFFRHTLDCICELAFGINPHTLSEEGSTFAKAFDVTQQISEQRFWRPFWKFWPEWGMRKNLKVLNDFAYKIISERKREGLEGKADVLSAYLRMEDENFSEEYLRDIILNFVIAGRDTTAQTLTWATYLISQHPHVEKKMLQELANVVGEDPLCYENVSKLEYMRAIVEETLRLYPPVPLDPKTAVEDDRLPTGQFIPKGTMVAWSAFCMGRSSELWPNPMVFDPERHLGASTRHPYAHVPFQAGPRQCLGMHMAHLEARSVLATMWTAFRFRLLPGHDVSYRKAVTLPAKYGMKMYIEARPARATSSKLD